MSDWKKTPSVYYLIHNDTKRIYTGSSTNPLSRIWGHFENGLVRGFDSNDVYEDIRKFGLTGFTFKVVAVCATMAEAEDLEKQHIARFVNAGHPVYNIRSTRNFKQFDTDVANPYVVDNPPAPGTKTKRPKPRKRLSSQEQELVVLMVKAGHTQQRVADYFDVARSTISKTLLRLGLRPTKVPCPRPANDNHHSDLLSILEDVGS